MIRKQMGRGFACSTKSGLEQAGESAAEKMVVLAREGEPPTDPGEGAGRALLPVYRSHWQQQAPAHGHQPGYAPCTPVQGAMPRWCPLSAERRQRRAPQVPPAEPQDMLTGA